MVGWLEKLGEEWLDVGGWCFCLFFGFGFF